MNRHETPEDVRLPDGLVVGASTSAHQTEGNNLASDWWHLEQSAGAGFVRERSGDAVDSLHRWREDMRLLADAGLRAYRFSVEWARIEPSDGSTSAAYVDHYAAMVAHARELGIEPVVTAHHFTSPLWFARAGGWTGDEAPDRFAAYLSALAPVVGAGVDRLVTLNEPNMLSVMAAVRGGAGTLEHGLGGTLLPTDDATTEALVRVHARARAHLRDRHPGLQVGWTVANQVVQAAPGGQEHADRYRERVEDVFLRAADGDDFVGVQAYTRNVVGADGRAVAPAPGVARTQTGWEYHPAALGDALRHTAAVLPRTPVLVTENGIATADDTERIAYTRGALHALATAAADGVDVRGYLHWSLLDNYEWGSWGPTFGLVEVDRTTFERRPRASLGWLGEVARTGVVPRA